MSFNAAPSGYFPGINTGAIVSGATGVFIPYTDLENYDVSTSGDIRQLVYAFNEAIANTYLSLDVNDRPTQMSINRSQNFSSPTVIRKVYGTSFNLAFSGTVTNGGQKCYTTDVVFESGV
jgi:hypothetical protein